MTPSGVWRTAASAFPVSLVEMQNLGPLPHLMNGSLQFNKVFGRFACSFKFETHHPRAQFRGSRSAPRSPCGQNGGNFGLEAWT